MASKILFFLAVFPMLAAVGLWQSPNAAVILGLKKSLNPPSLLYWNDSHPCKLKNVRCWNNRIGPQKIGGFLSSKINEVTSLKGSASDYPIEGKVPDFSTSVNLIILGFVVLCPVIIIIVVLVFFLCRDSSSNVETRGIGTMGFSVHQELEIVTDDCLVFSVQVLKNATDDFNEQNILGRGGFGTVYKGVLRDGTKIAVKRMKPERMSGEGLDMLKSEISAIKKFNHLNLVKLLGYCLKGSERLLVFELMTQGKLDRFLFHWKEEGLKPLEWMKRLGIALDVAWGVEYLHNFARQNFIHRDLKSSNILLGDDMRAKVSDFRLVLRMPPDEEASASAKFVGAFGYIAPEYAATGRVSRKIDVYSFGVILMELITGRKALDMSLPKEKQHIVAWFHDMKGTNAFPNIIDPNLDLGEQETLSSIITLAELAGNCTSREPNRRPNMSHVVSVLLSLAGVLKPIEINDGMILDQMIEKWKAWRQR